MNTAYTTSENELLMSEQAVLRPADSDLGSGVVLLPSHRTLCRCDDEDHARLLVKLFNLGLKVVR
jgi:hypothetical protein